MESDTPRHRYSPKRAYLLQAIVITQAGWSSRVVVGGQEGSDEEILKQEVCERMGEDGVEQFEG